LGFALLSATPEKGEKNNRGAKIGSKLETRAGGGYSSFERKAPGFVRADVREKNQEENRMNKKTLLVVGLVIAVAMLFVFSASAATKVGPEKCKMCHKLQYESWSASKHATQNPPVDCETCHGPGSDYKVMSIMKDVEKAKAAGLILPTKEDCAKCHGKGKVPAMTDELFAKVHAHKAK
jgi:DnaJ-class molecular chaperone